MYNAENEFLPNQLFESIIDYPEYTGSDTIDGGEGDDILMGQEMDDVIEGGGGSDDIYGGHHKRHGFDVNDTLSGGPDDDVILGDNGQILRESYDNLTEFPWTVHEWKPYSTPFDSEIIHDVKRYDDIDLVQGEFSHS